MSFVFEPSAEATSMFVQVPVGPVAAIVPVPQTVLSNVNWKSLSNVAPNGLRAYYLSIEQIDVTSEAQAFQDYWAYYVHTVATAVNLYIMIEDYKVQLVARNAIVSNLNSSLPENPTNEELEVVANASAESAALSIEINSLTTQYTTIISAQPMQWVPLPSIQEIMDALNTLMASSDADLSSIQATIAQLLTSSDTFDAFITTMQLYQNYELLIKQQLEQMDTFLEGEAEINLDMYEEEIPILQVEMNNVITAYKNIIEENNAKAIHVKECYTTSKTRIDRLSDITNVMKVIQKACEDLSAAKRFSTVSGTFSYSKVVFFPVNSTNTTYAANAFLPLNVVLQSGASKYGVYGIQQIGTSTVYQLPYSLTYDSTSKLVKNNSTNVLNIVVKFEVLATSEFAFDTRAELGQVIVHNSNSDPYSNGIQRIQKFDSVNSTLKTTKIQLLANEYVHFEFTRSLTVSNALISIQIA